MGLMCVFPETPEPITPRSQDTVSTIPKSGVNLDHLRFFRHFLLEAYPPAPHDAQPVWHEVAALSHEVCTLPNVERDSLIPNLTPLTVRVPRECHSRPRSPTSDPLPRGGLLHPGT
jgi:hypothetical protein